MERENLVTIASMYTPRGLLDVDIFLQMLSKENVNPAVDIYGFGCMVIKLCDGRKQYKNEVSL